MALFKRKELLHIMPQDFQLLIVKVSTMNITLLNYKIKL